MNYSRKDRPARGPVPAVPPPPTGYKPQRFSSGPGHISLDDVEPVDIRVRGLGVSVEKPTAKALLDSVSATFLPGTLTAILGGSGSGKTTLLNTMSERMTSSRLTQNGTIHFNGSPGVHAVRHAYVMQQDILIPTLTVRETLRYSANLRLPPGTTSASRAKVVEDVIRELGLKECADTRIGNSEHRGISGGEKRRTSLGVQMLSNPSVLFLDEPTTGLDATNAYQLVRTLRKLAAKGRTIITTIHQPRSEIWELFDNIIILTQGTPVYSGPRTDCIPWFEGLGSSLPEFVNPAEHVIDLAVVDNRTPQSEKASTTRVNFLKAKWDTESRRMYSRPAIIDVGKRKKAKTPRNVRASPMTQLRVLTARTFKVTYRDPLGMTSCLLEAVVLGAVTGYIFFNLPRDQSGIRSRYGALYTAAALQSYLALMFEVYRLTIDIPTFDRERAEGYVDAIPYLVSRRLARMFTEDIPVPFLFSIIFYFLAGFDREFEKFYFFFAITLINQYISVTAATVCVASIRHFAGASLIANLMYMLQGMASGIFIQSDSLPVYVQWMKWITFTYYTFGAYCGNEFQGSIYDCPFPGGRSNPQCAPFTGEFVMASLGFPTNWLARPMLAMVGFVGFFFVTSVVLLIFKKNEMTMGKSRPSEPDLSAGKEEMNARPAAEVRSIDLGLDKFGLALDKRNIRGTRLPRETIVKPVTTIFQAGVINVIMGPSGSGKTSLLNAMAQRLNNTLGTRYRTYGKITFNGAVPSDPVVRSVCSYVCQDDEGLLPSLTVRETLRFAAGLRLPSFMSRKEKNRRAEEILLKMGLKDCADNLIGSELVKGISGGEKRRVTIAVQILTDPRILILDEPTSGLDAFTASSVMEVLQGLASEGRTIILSIHQARSDLFKHFGNVLLLARGGSPVYAGAAREMIPYFSRLGYECPTHTNPADFALDLVTINLQQEQKEAESRKKVIGLIKTWQAKQDMAMQESYKEKVLQLPAIEGLGEDSDWWIPYLLESDYQKWDGSSGTDDDSVRTSDLYSTSSDTLAAPEHRSESQQQILAVPKRRYSRHNKTVVANPAELGALVRKKASFFIAFPILVHRATINFARQPALISSRISQVLSLGLILALFFSPLKNDAASVQNRLGFVQEIGAFYFMGVLQNVGIYPAERDVFYREADDGVYGVEAFLATYTLLETPLTIAACMIFGVIAEFAVGLPHSVVMYMVTSFAAFGVVSCGESLGIMFNTLFSHTGFAVNLTSIVLSVASTMAGVLSIDMPTAFVYANYLSPIRYAARAFAVFSLQDITFTCDPSQKLPDGQCVVATGKQALQLYKLDENPITNIIALGICVVAYRALAYFLLKLARIRFRNCSGG